MKSSKLEIGSEYEVWVPKLVTVTETRVPRKLSSGKIRRDLVRCVDRTGRERLVPCEFVYAKSTMRARYAKCWPGLAYDE